MQHLIVIDIKASLHLSGVLTWAEDYVLYVCNNNNANYIDNKMQFICMYLPDLAPAPYILCALSLCFVRERCLYKVL